MRAFRLVLLVLAFANVLASAQEQSQSARQATATAQSKASVYVYRYQQFLGSALGPSVYCDEVQLARMDNGRYFTVKIDPGKHTFRSNDAQSGVELDVKAGQDYFIRVEIATGFMKEHGRLILTSAEQGRSELKSSMLKPLDAGKVVDKERVSVDEVQMDTPSAPTAAATPQAPAPAQPSTKTQVLAQPPHRETLPNGEHTISGVTLSEGSAGTGDQVSLAEAARRARQKKATADSTTATPQ